MDRLANPFPENNDGAVYALKGRFIMPVLRSKDGKAVSPVKAALLTVTACLLFAGLFVGAQAIIETTNYDLPYQSALQPGLSKEAVLQEMELEEDGLRPVSQSVYTVTDGCTYAGVPFDLQLRFDGNSHLAGYAYTTTLTAAPKDAANTAAKVLGKLDMLYNGNHIHGDCMYIKKQALTDELAGLSAPYELIHSRNITPEDNGASVTASYLQDLEASDTWQYKVSGYVVRRACLYNDVSVTYDPGTQQLALTVSYTVEADRAGA